MPINQADLGKYFTLNGFLLPRLPTTVRDSIRNPAESLLQYNTTLKTYNYFDGIKWVILETLKESIDIQIAAFMTPITTTSTTFVDIPGLAITTKNITTSASPGEGTYLIWFNAEVEQSQNNQDVFVQIVIGGVILSISPRQVDSPGGGEPFMLATQGFQEDIVTGTEIKMQWHTESTGTASMNAASMIVFGVKESWIKA